MIVRPIAGTDEVDGPHITHGFACTCRYLPQDKCFEHWLRGSLEFAEIAEIEHEFGVRAMVVVARATFDSWRCSDSDADLYDACQATILAAERWIENPCDEHAEAASRLATRIPPPTPSWAHNCGLMIRWPSGNVHDRDPQRFWSRLGQGCVRAAKIYPADEDGLRKVIQAKVVPWVLE
jgi:hypothetical protein